MLEARYNSSAHEQNTSRIQISSELLRRGVRELHRGPRAGKVSLLPPCVDDDIEPDAMVRVVDAFVASLDVVELGEHDLALALH
jgi:hypothetical protein